MCAKYAGDLTCKSQTVCFSFHYCLLMVLSSTKTINICRVSDPMVNPLSAMVWPLEKFDLYKFIPFYISRHITNAKLHKFWHIDQRKYQRVPQNLDNPKNGWTLEWGWAVGHLPYYNCFCSPGIVGVMMYCRRDSLLFPEQLLDDLASEYLMIDCFLSRFLFQGFVLPILEYRFAVWCSAADTHFKLLDCEVSGAIFFS